MKVESGNLKNKEKNSQLSRLAPVATQGAAKRATLNSQLVDIDLTLAYEKLRKMDPSATWFLHIGKKMLLNGSVKNPKMRPTRLGLSDIIKVLRSV